MERCNSLAREEEETRYRFPRQTVEYDSFRTALKYSSSNYLLHQEELYETIHTLTTHVDQSQEERVQPTYQITKHMSGGIDQ